MIRFKIWGLQCLHRGRNPAGTESESTIIDKGFNNKLNHDHRFYA
jgi:hypothetical protein